ncbi:SNF2-related protein [Undibacterium sp. Ji42W]|uniref:SNF2-related protein n=1 Tax=Undibacterium sp. Ji42W TaxID=3413039 RepID=UPI003BEFE1B3
MITSAKEVMHKGWPIVAVPHRPDEVLVLRNMGYNPPDPLPMYYDFPGGKTPFKAQISTANFASMNSRCFILNSMGTGKTISSLWAADYMQRIKRVNRILVACPLSTMQDTWANEAFYNFPDKTVVVIYGTAKQRLKRLEQEADIYIINTDGVEIIADALAKRPDIDLIIIDELALYRNASTNRWKAMNRVCNKQTPRKVWGMTGAPMPHLPTDVWSQIRLVTPTSTAISSSFVRFRELVMRPVGPHKWVPKEDAVQTVFGLMQPSIRFALDDCLDLPPQTLVTREVELTPEQKKAYKDMMKRLKTEYANGEILAVNAAVKAAKLLQISLGVAYGPNKELVVIPSQHRINVLREIIEESEGKVIVFVPLTGALEYVAEQLRSEWTVATVSGATSKSQRDEIFHNFQRSKDPHVLVANPSTMSHGLTLTAATTIVWCGPTNSNDTYVQACARVRRPGQKRTTVIVHLVGSPIERVIFERLQGKQELQNVLLDLLKEQKDD